MCRREGVAAINPVLILMVDTENVQEGRSYCNQSCVDGKYHGLNA